jgi:uncharacterized membrane protein (DUF4010 family)
MGDLPGSSANGSDLALSLNLQAVQHWPYLPILMRIALAVALGLVIGMERERRGKEAGMRTFAFTSLLGCLCGLLGDAYALLGIGLLGVLVVFMNWQRLQTNQTAELTTSAALLVTGVMGVLCGKGHDFTPVLVGVLAAALLAWKERMTHFSVGLTEAEIRSAILLGILAFVVYPVLPTRAVDPWGLIEPRSAWITVLLIATVGFGNYILLKLYGARGAAIAGFLGGLVNSTVVVAELAGRTRDTAGEDGHTSLVNAAYHGTVLATAAMLLRNGVLLTILAPVALLRGAAIPLLLMLLTCAALTLPTLLKQPQPEQDTAPDIVDETTSRTASACPAESASAESTSLRLKSPFSLSAALKFGLIFLVLHVAGTLAQRGLGAFGVYAVSIAGGMVSSASAVASAGSLAAQGSVSPAVAGTGAVLASLASALINLPLIARVADTPILITRVRRALLLVLLVGLVGALVQIPVAPALHQVFVLMTAAGQPR